MNKPKISVIIPVYKVEKYIHQCVDSVINQTYKNIEIVIVDDGSPDNCPHICDDYAKNDNRVTVIHKKNGGLSSARNAGIRKATGEYLIFLDSDDYWDDTNAIKDLVTQIQGYESDILTWGYKKLHENSSILNNVRVSIDRTLLINQIKEDAFPSLVKHNCYVASACNKMIKRELFVNNNLYFDEGVLSEDIEWSSRLAIYANTFDVYDNTFYIYRQRAGSISKTITRKNVDDLTNNFLLSYDLLREIKSKKIQDAYLSYLSIQLANLLIVLNITKDIQVNKYIKLLNKYMYILSFGYTNRVKIIYLINKILGIKMTVKLLGVVLKMKKIR